MKAAQIRQRGLTCVAKDRVGKPCSGSPIYGSDGSGCRPALAAAASPDCLTPPCVHSVLVLGLLATLTGGRGSRASMGGASTSQARNWSCGCSGGGWWRSWDHLVQSGALPQRVQAWAAPAWRKTGTEIMVSSTQHSQILNLINPIISQY